MLTSCNSTANEAGSVNGGDKSCKTDSSSLMSFPNESCPSADLMDQNDNKWVSVILNWLHSSHDRPAVQTEALWALTNIAGLVPPSGIMNNAAAASTARSIPTKGGVSSNAAPISSWPFSSVNNTNNNVLPTHISSSSSSSLNSNNLELSLQGKWERCDNSSIDLQQQQQQLIEEKKLLLQGFNDAINGGSNSNVDAFMNNAALSDFLEQAALNGVSFDPATLAAAVQLCAATASNSTTANSSNNNNHWASSVATADAMMNMNLNMTAAAHHQPKLQFAEAASSFASSAAAAAAAAAATAASSLFPSSLFQLPSHSTTIPANSHSTLPSAAATTATPMVPEQYLNYSSFSSGGGPCTNALLSHVDALPTLISLLKSPHRQVHEQAMWILGSIVVGGSSSSNNNCSSSTTNNSSLASTPSATTSVDPFYHDNNKNINNNNKNYHHSSNKESVLSSSSSSANMTNSNNNVAIAREAVLAAGILEPLCTCLNDNAWNISLQRIGSWLLSNLVIPNANANNNNNSNSKNNMNTAALSCGTTPDITTTTFNTILNNLSNDVGGSSSRASNREGDNLPTKSSPNQESNFSSLPGSYFDVQIILPTLRRLLFSGDADVLSHTCWAFSHLCDGPSVHIAAVVCDSTVDGATHMTIPQRLVELLLHPSWRVTKPALRTIGNIVCAECATAPTSSSAANMDTLLSTAPPSKLTQQLQQVPQDYTEVVLQSGAVPRLKTLISHSNREIQKEACWTLSNIAAGTISQIQAVMNCGAIPPLVALASDPSADHEVRSEACWVVLNATSCGSDDQVEQLVADGCVNVLGVLLKEASMVMMALEGLERVLQVEEAREANALLLSNSASSKSTRSMSSAVLGSVVNPAMIESLEQHKNSAVAKRAARIWKQVSVFKAVFHDGIKTSLHLTSNLSSIPINTRTFDLYDYRATAFRLLCFMSSILF